MTRILKTNVIDSTRAAFFAGWFDGRRLGERTARQAMQDYPTMPYMLLDAYLQGTVDGARVDRFRLTA